MPKGKPFQKQTIKKRPSGWAASHEKRIHVELERKLLEANLEVERRQEESKIWAAKRKLKPESLAWKKTTPPPPTHRDQACQFPEVHPEFKDCGTQVYNPHREGSSTGALIRVRLRQVKVEKL